MSKIVISDLAIAIEHLQETEARSIAGGLKVINPDDGSVKIVLPDGKGGTIEIPVPREPITC